MWQKRNLKDILLMCLYILWAEPREQVKSPYLLETISSATVKSQNTWTTFETDMQIVGRLSHNFYNSRIILQKILLQ